MKTRLILLASIAMGSAAFAQEAVPVAPPAPATQMPTTPAGPEASAPGVTATDAAAPTTTNTSATVPDTTAPVAASAEAADTSSYPVCSRSVTDKCVQSHPRHRAHPR
jgi:hypothetical protein